jgi:hypothetical protein
MKKAQKSLKFLKISTAFIVLFLIALLYNFYYLFIQLFVYKPITIILIPTWILTILFFIKDKFLGFKIKKQIRQKILFYTIFISFVIFYSVFFSKNTLILAQTPSCTRANPTVTISPSSQTAQAGTTLTYTVSIKNNDNSACGSSTFSLSVSSCPSGWTCRLSKSSVKISPGSTDSSTTINVTSPSTASAGTYTFKVKATNSASNKLLG